MVRKCTTGSQRVKPTKKVNKLKYVKKGFILLLINRRLLVLRISGRGPLTIKNCEPIKQKLSTISLF